MLEDQLVEVGQVVLHPEPEDAGHLLLGGDGEGPVTVGDLDVGSHAFYMLRVGHASHKLVEPFTAVAAGHDDGQLEALARGCETAHGEIPQADDVPFQWDIGYLVFFSLTRSEELREHEMLCKPLIEVYDSLHILLL